MYLNDLFTIPTSLARFAPGISVKPAWPTACPPIIGKALDEATVLRIARAFEQSTEWHTLRSPVARRES
jgi:aspartyl-tRNA(Asn)/glutamyl-tRNA(Gln) amidotransferase subunit A